MSLPASHPPVHAHKGKTCPVIGKGHGWCPSQPGDSRSPCPAMNTLANHGYIARDGKNLGVLDLTFGLMAGYNLSFPLALFLSIGGFVLLKRIWPVSLYEFGKHGAIEHDASLVHSDTPPGEKYAPIEIHQELVQQLIDDVKTDGKGIKEGVKSCVMDSSDVARARIRREKGSPALDGLHAEVARGEMAIILGVWETKVGTKVGVPVEWLREWLGQERLPSDWKATHVQGLFDVVKRAKAIRSSMDQQRKEPPQESFPKGEKSGF